MKVKNVYYAWVCRVNGMCCQTETEFADEYCYPTQSHFFDMRPTRFSYKSIMPAAWQGRHLSTTGMTRPGKPDPIPGVLVLRQRYTT